MSLVEVPKQSPALHRSPSSSLSTSGKNGLSPDSGGSVPPTKLNPLASDFDPGARGNGTKQQSQEPEGSQGGRGGRGAGRGAGGRGGGRGGIASAMSRPAQLGGQQQQQQQTPSRQGSAGVAPAPADPSAGGGGGASAGGGSSGGGGGSGGGSGAGGRGGGAPPAAVGGRSGGVTNANHLLNFQYESARGASGRGGGGRGGGRTGGGRGGAGGSSSGAARRYGNTYASKPQKYDKNKFLQANFRFLVSDAVDVWSYEADADKMFDWEDVLQVEMASCVAVQCPISLDSPPLCPQITPCGHIFSFPAIMHHLVNHGGEQLRRSAPCPLCFAPVVARELRLVRVRTASQPAAGQSLTLALIRRNRTSIIPQPVDPEAAAAATATAAAAAAAAAGGGGGGGAGGGGAAEPPSPFDANPFAKFVVAAGGDAGELWRGAAQQLAACAMQLVAEGGADAAREAPFVYGSLEQLALRARRWAEHRGEALAGRGLLAAREGPGAEPGALGAAAEAAVKQMFTAAVSDVNAAARAAEERAALEAQFPSLGPSPAAAAAAAPPPPSPGSQRAARAASGSGGGSGSVGSDGGGGGAGPGGAAKSPPGGSIAAAVPAAAAPAEATASAAGGGGPAAAVEPGPSEPPPAFDAMFPMDETEPEEQDDQQRVAAAAEGADGQPGGRRRSSGGDGAAAAAAGGGGGGELSSSFGGGGGGGPGGVLGTSPSSSALNTPGVAGEFYTYQAADGSWLFLHPLNLRCLLSHYGSYDACPPVITGRLLELEDVVQSDAVRRRWRFLSHLPLGGAFKLCELALAELLPPEALAPYADDLAAREKRRRRQRADERRQAAAEAAAAARAAAARLGPSAEELQAMPALGQAAGGGAAGVSGLVAAAGATAAALAREIALSPSEVAESIALQASLEDAAAAAAATATVMSPSAGGGVSFARITKMGFAATGPALGSSPPLGAAALPAPAGAWGARAAGGGGGAAAAAAAGLVSPSSPWGGVPAAAPGAAGAVPGLGGAWGGGKGGAAVKAAAAAAAAVGPGAGGAKAGGAEQEGGAGGGKKSKGGKGTLLFSLGQQRKY